MYREIHVISVLHIQTLPVIMSMILTETTTIRKATLGDNSAIFELANQLHDKITVDEQTYQKTFKCIIENSNQLLYVAESNSKLIGYFSANIHSAIYANGEVMYLDEIVVDAGHRDRKIGNLLMAELEKQASQHNCVLISLATAGATEFYLKIGYSSKAGYYKKYLQ
ncbi:MAG: N-acetylglutamate synthase-like GNAT family acetyltransferase [Saprospiraceae bacterium]|jgi:N-acetylglutamate synthase-like GNAT family acetyltransferase